MRLYDSDYCISFMRAKVGLSPGSAAQTLGAIKISVITLFELWTGVHKCSQPAKELQKLNHFLIGTTTMAMDEADARRAAKIRAHLESKGQVIGPYDLLIAAQALEHGMTVVTRNVREFSRVPGLKIDDWNKW